jgi:flagellar biosynthesis/type III secretory pathway ATPase
MANKNRLSNTGVVVSVRGSVVDIVFDTRLPPIYSLLHAQEGQIAIEVLSQLDAYRVRGIALTPTQGLARGMPVEDSGGPLQAPVGKGILSRMFDVFGNVIDRQPTPADIQWRSVQLTGPWQAISNWPMHSSRSWKPLPVLAPGWMTIHIKLSNTDGASAPASNSRNSPRFP